MSDADFATVDADSWMRSATSPRPARDYRGIMLNAPGRVLAREQRTPHGVFPLRLVISLTVRLSLADERRLRAQGMRQTDLDLVVAAFDHARGEGWSGRPADLRLGEPEIGRTFDEASDAEAERTVYTRYCNPDLARLLALPARPAVLHVAATLGPWSTPSAPIVIEVP